MTFVPKQVPLCTHCQHHSISHLFKKNEDQSKLGHLCLGCRPPGQTPDKQEMMDGWTNEGHLVVYLFAGDAKLMSRVLSIIPFISVDIVGNEYHRLAAESRDYSKKSRECSRATQVKKTQTQVGATNKHLYGSS